MRARLLAIVLIPSIALLSIGIGASAYLVNDGRAAKEWADLATGVTEPCSVMVKAFQLERSSSMLHLAGDPTATANLAAARKNSDAALDVLRAQGGGNGETNKSMKSDIDGFNELYSRLPVLRSAIDSRAIPPAQAMMFYNTVIDTIVQGGLIAAKIAPEASIALKMSDGIEPLRLAEGISRAGDLGSPALLTNRFSAEQLTEFVRYVGDARGKAAYAGQVLVGARQAELKAITDSADWQRLTAMEDAIVRRGVVEPDDDVAETPTTSSRTSNSTTVKRSPQTSAQALPLNAAEWTAVSTQIRSELMKLWMDSSYATFDDAAALGAEQQTKSLWGGAAVSAVTLLAFLAALFLANRFVGRMRKLRGDTLRLADERLPETIRTLSEGRQVDGGAEFTALDFGADEVGQVAEAFNRAHRSAIAAAVAESKTRTGVNAVFLNIAHRSQVMVHRQLALLDRAEREEDDPAKLDVLFQLDHLATRSRRNAENLIILGGEMPGRRWRNPVPLMDVVRSAVAESLDYTRIQTGRLPDVRIGGATVTDLIHLVAELTDNATAYSPPESRVEITGNTVGRGLAIEISDQGLGMSQAEIVERNALLADPPDFSVAALSSDTRLGLFVVAKLAARHGISVRLAESDYGGIRAIVLVPTTLLATGPEHEPAESRIEAREFTPRPALTPAAVATVAAVVTPEPIVSPPPLPSSSGEKPALPRRRRATAESTVVSEEPVQPAPPTPRPRSADEARNLMSAIENGTRQGRLNRAGSDIPPRHFDRQEGTGDDLQAP